MQKILQKLFPLIYLLLTFLVLFNVLNRNLFARSDDVIIERISTAEGLAHKHVHCVMQDSFGFLWIGTDDGLQRYDGYEFVDYKNYTQDTTSLSSLIVNIIEEDVDGNLWIGTFNGLNLYQRKADSFVQYKFDQNNEYSISNSDRIRAITIDQNNSNYVWIGTHSAGLNLFDKELKRFYHFRHNPENNMSLSSDNISSVFQDDLGNLWIGTSDAGLNRINLKSLSITADDKYDISQFDSVIFEHYLNNQNNEDSLVATHVYNIFNDKSNTLWVLLDSGVFIFDKKKNNFKSSLFFNSFFSENPNVHFHEMVEDLKGKFWFGAHNKILRLDRINQEIKEFLIDKGSIRSGSNQALCEDKAGNIWFATWDGLIKIHEQDVLFNQYVHNPDDPSSLNSDFIHSILVDRSAQIWIGTNRGLSKMLEDSNKVVKFIYNSESPEITTGLVSSLVEDIRGEIWSIIDNNLVRINPKHNSIIKYKNDIVEIENIGIADQDLWISSQDSGFYRVRLSDLYSTNDLKDVTLTNYLDDPANPAGLILYFIQDSFGYFWLCTKTAGVIKFDPQANLVKNYKFEQNNPNSINRNNIEVVYEDKKGNIWLGTNGGGLNRFDRQLELFTHITTSSGLASDVIRGILEDDNGNLWISTNRGITKYNPEKQKIRNFELQGFEYWSEFFRDQERGEMFFGGGMGLVVFHPDSIKESDYIPPVVLTKFTRYSEEIDEKPLIDRTIFAKENVELSYKDDIISFEFAALNFNRNSKCEYAYKLEGFNHNWINLGTKREVTFTNLDPGNYTFRIKDCNEDGIWNESAASLQIYIVPPWWQTWWAYSVYVIGFLGFLVGIRSYELNRRKEKEDRRILELENERKSRELEEARELQLSMLPRELPVLPQLDIAAYLKTATEVGGDFYDFHLNEEGILTTIVADATGHGMQAGTMVTATKGLFQNLAELADLGLMYHQFNRAICAMGLQPRLNALLALRIKETQLEIINGGMPGLLIYKKRNNAIEEIEASGPPLGAICDYSYKLYKTSLSKGDVILSMSDGFIERFNEKDELLGYDTCKQIFRKVAFANSQEIINHFVKEADEWGGSIPQYDDITFVIIKCR
jgi:ligand-binding sensor domain-containing protein/serine phosphatase RsbU (regulator of sigma subunit)